MPTIIAEGTLTTDGTEQTLAVDTANKTYVLKIDTAAMVNGDEIELRVKDIVRSGGTERVGFYAAYRHAQSQPVKYSEPIPADISCKATIKRTAGPDRAYPWKLLSL